MVKSKIFKRKCSFFVLFAVVTLFAICFLSPANVSVVSADTGFNMNNATKLTLDKRHNIRTKHVSNTDDRFYKTYKFKTTNNNSFYNIKLKNNAFGPIQIFYQLYDPSGDKVEDFSSGIIYEGSQANNEKLEKNSWYYLGIYYYGEAEGEYSIEIDEIKDDVGDDFYSAKEIKEGDKPEGTINSEKDEDAFLIRATRTGKYKIVFINQSANSTHCLYFDIYNDDKQLVKNDYNIWDTVSYVVNLKKGECCWVFMSGLKSGSLIDSPVKYKLKVYGPKIARPSKVRLKSVKAGKRSLTIKYSAAKRTTCYQVAYKKKGAAWKYCKVNGISKKILKLSKKKKYTVKVRGIRVFKGKKYPGKWSKTKSVIVK